MRRSSIRPLVQEPTKTVSTSTSRIGVPAVEAHVLQGLLGGDPVGRVLEVLGVGHRAAQRHALAGVGAPGDERRHRRSRRARSRRRSRRPSSVRSVLQCATAASQSAPFGASGRPSM